jgi:putative DNA primase/helicase
MRHVGGQVDIYRATEVAAILIPLVAIAEELRVTIIGVMHLNKQDAANILYRVQASVAFVGSARSVIAFAPDPDLNKTESRILCHIKANYSEKGPCQEIHITDKKGIGHAEWQGESDLKATDVFGKPRSASEGKKIREAEDFIMEMMIDGEMPSNEIFDEADSRKISERTLNRAKKNLRIEAGRSKDGSRGIWKWPKKTARDLAKEKK